MKKENKMKKDYQIGEEIRTWSVCIPDNAAKEVEKTLLKYYPPETPVAIGYRVSWEDQWLKIVPLKNLALESREKGLFRTTLYIISPALKLHNQRSNLYHESHKHLFRSK